MNTSNKHIGGKCENQFYIRRINCVMDYIEENIDAKLSLTELANVATISKYHFHRVFKAVCGETINNYIKRRKMECACRQIVNEKNKSLTQIAFDNGYNSSSNFSRDFYNYYSSSPSKIRELKQTPYKRKVNHKTDLDITYSGINIIPDKKVIYIRISTGYDPAVIQPAFNKLFEFSQKNNFFYSPEQFIGIGYDDPDYTPLAKCRYDACLNIDEMPKELNNNPFNTKILKSATYAVFLFEGLSNEMFHAWDAIFRDWLVNSNYIPDNRPHLEMYLPCQRYLQGYYKANLCLPVKKL